MENILNFDTSKKQATKKRSGLLVQVGLSSTALKKDRLKNSVSPYLNTNVRRSVNILACRYKDVTGRPCIKRMTKKWYYILLQWIRDQRKTETGQVELASDILVVTKWVSLDGVVADPLVPAFTTMTEFLKLWDKLSSLCGEHHLLNKLILKHGDNYLFDIAIRQGVSKQNAGALTEFCVVTGDNINEWCRKPKNKLEHIKGDMYRTVTTEEASLIGTCEKFRDSISYENLVYYCSRLLIAYPGWYWKTCVCRYIEDSIGVDAVNTLLEASVLCFNQTSQHLPRPTE